MRMSIRTCQCVGAQMLASCFFSFSLTRRLTLKNAFSFKNPANILNGGKSRSITLLDIVWSRYYWPHIKILGNFDFLCLFVANCLRGGVPLIRSEQLIGLNTRQWSPHSQNDQSDTRKCKKQRNCVKQRKYPMWKCLQGCPTSEYLQS